MLRSLSRPEPPNKKKRNDAERLSLVVIFCLSVICSFQSAFAYPSTPLLNFLSQSRSDHKRNHNLCYAYEDTTPGLPCNPAFLSNERQSTPWIYSYGNNNLQFFQDVSDIVKGPIRAGELLAIVDHNSHDNFQVELSLGYLANNWGINFIPEKVVLFSNFRNPALPRISILAARERELQFQLGSAFDSQWSWGLQFRALQRRFLYSDAYFSDHLTDDINQLYLTRTQEAWYIEPSLSFAPENTDWNPLFSLMITNLGQTQQPLEPYNFDPTLRGGLSIRNHLEYGVIQLGVTSQWIRLADRDTLYSGFGGSYRYSYFELFGTLSELEQQLGIAFNDDSSGLTGAISYAEQDWNNTPSAASHGVWRWDFGVQF